jgi:hypothetical protein
MCSGDVMFPARYELGFYIPEDGILHSQSRENLKFYNLKVIGLGLIHLAVERIS